MNPLNVGDGYDGLTCHREDLIIDSEPGCFGGRTLFHPANRGDLLWVECGVPEPVAWARDK